MKINEKITDTYDVLEEIGSGSGGTVYKAYHKRLHKYVVMKRINSPSRSTMRNRQEVDILKNLQHTYLPSVLDFFETDEGIFTVMSYIPGKSLKTMADEGAHFSRNDLLKWGMQLCNALNYLHSQPIPIVHGDIKPANIMLKPDGDICLIDFNISFFLDENTVLGYTDGYTSPEQYMAVNAQRKRGATKFVINDKADIYSVGATLYFLATGMKRRNYNEAIDMKRLTDAVGRPFAEIIKKALDSDPAKRFQSAAQMFRALKELPKKEEKYKSFLRIQRIKLILLCAGAVLFAGVSCFGFLLMQDQRYDKYDEIVDQQIACIETGDYATADSKFNEATDLIASDPEAYYQKAYGLYVCGKYDECINFIENEVIGNRHVKKKGQRIVDIYALEGLCYLEMDQAAKAVEQFERAMEYGAFSAGNYRDYAIALAYGERYDEAEDMLDKAEKAGLSSGAVSYTRGEVHFAKGEYDSALAAFLDCISQQDDPYMSMRAYIMAGRIYRETGDLSDSRAVLLQALDQLPVQNQPAILESLVQTDIDLADRTGDTSYRQEAGGYRDRIIQNGWAGYSDYDTLAVLCQMQGDFSQVNDTLQKMTDLYGKDYNIQKRYAFMEVSIQELKSQDARDYSQFEKYYDEANTLYSAASNGNNTDQEMQLLDNVYQQLRAGGWL